jgi:hypothetical protein
MLTKKSINPEINAALFKYIEAVKISKNNPDDKILKIQVSYLKYIIKSLILKDFINGN